MTHVMVSKLLCMTGSLIGAMPSMSHSEPGHSPADQDQNVLLESETMEGLMSEWGPDEFAQGGEGTRSGECRTDDACSNYESNYPPGTFSTTSVSFVTVSTDIWPGDYAYYSVTSGCTYEWTLCAEDAANAPYDSQLTLRSQNGSVLYCYSDDFCSGFDAKIRWTATFSGTVLVLVSEYNCQTDAFINTTLRWRRESCGAQLPDLEPYQHPGYANTIVISSNTGDHLDDDPLYDNQTLYVDWAAHNIGTGSTADTFYVLLKVDGVVEGVWIVNPPVTPNIAFGVDDFSIGILAAGPHTVSVEVDYDNRVPESNELNNNFERTINVTAAEPDIGLDPLSLAFDCAAPAEDCFTLSNAGSDTLHVPSITKPAWATLTPPPPYDIAIGGNQEVCVTVDCGACAGSGLEDELLISSDDPDEPSIILPLAVGCPLSNLVSAVSRKSNSGGPGGVCDLPIDLAAGGPITSEMRLGEFAEVVFTYDGPPPPANLTAEVDCTCPSPPSYASTSVGVACVPSAANVVCTFAPSVAAPGLTNACTYRFTVPSGAGTAQVELRVLIGDANGDGRVNSTDRSLIVSAWTDPAHFSCDTDLDSSGRSNATDRSLAVSAWTGVGTNCAP